jgi:hypothetical protein
MAEISVPMVYELVGHSVNLLSGTGTPSRVRTIYVEGTTTATTNTITFATYVAGVSAILGQGMQAISGASYDPAGVGSMGNRDTWTPGGIIATTKSHTGTGIYKSIWYVI